MQTRMKAVYPSIDHYKIAEPFGYATKGIPGLDIYINGKSAKMMKEKFIFITKSAGLRLPLKHYVLCVEETVRDESLLWLELPMLILFFSLAELLPIHHLEDCVASGKVFSSGRIGDLSYSESLLEFLEMYHPELKIISSGLLPFPSRNHHFPLELLFEGKSYFQFSQEKFSFEKEERKRWPELTG